MYAFHVLAPTPFQGTVSFSDSDYTVRESRGFVPVTVEIKESLTVPFTVTVETQDETAVSECSYMPYNNYMDALILLYYCYLDQVDYEGGQFNITFQIGQIRVPFNITIVNDEEPPLEPDETFRINFLPPVNQPEFATVTIKDKCTRQCQNGGTLDSSVCNCTCPPLYTGLSCESELLTIFIMKVTAWPTPIHIVTLIVIETHCCELG